MDKKSLEKELLKLWKRACLKYWGNKCEVCQKPAIDPHHYISRSASLGLKYNIMNCVPLCKKCHSQLKWKDASAIDAQICLSRGEDWIKYILAMKEYFKKNPVRKTKKFLLTQYETLRNIIKR